MREETSVYWFAGSLISGLLLVIKILLVFIMSDSDASAFIHHDPESQSQIESQPNVDRAVNPKLSKYSIDLQQGILTRFNPTQIGTPLHPVFKPSRISAKQVLKASELPIDSISRYRMSISQKMMEFQSRRSELQRLVKHHLNFTSFPLTQEQTILYFEQYQSKTTEFDKDDVESNMHFQIRRGKENIYYGMIINDKKHGKAGLYLSRNGRLYEGEWENDLKHGKGFEIFPNGSFYNGHYVNGKPEGIGTFEWPNGEAYEGQWMNGVKHGSGIWKGSKGDSYIGEWKFGKADGYGVHTWVNGDRYEGEFRNCLKTGQGSEKFANGDTYVGNYENGKAEGYGEYFWSNGTVYKGNFRGGLRHGEGIWMGGTGLSEKYEGNFENDKKCGRGVFTWPNGNRYEGEYKDDLRQGYGEMHWNDGSFYKGSWINGLQEGEGCLCISGHTPKKGLFKANKLISYLPDIKNQVPTISEVNDDYNSIEQVKPTKQNNLSNSPRRNPQRMQPTKSQSLQQKQESNQRQWALVQYQQKQQEQLASQLRDLHRQQQTLQMQQIELQKNQIAITQSPIIQKQFSSDYFHNRQQMKSFESHAVNESESSGLRRHLPTNSDDGTMKKFIDSFTQTQEFQSKKYALFANSNHTKTNRVFYPKLQHRSVQISPKSQNTSQNKINLSSSRKVPQNIPQLKKRYWVPSGVIKQKTVMK